MQQSARGLTCLSLARPRNAHVQSLWISQCSCLCASALLSHCSRGTAAESQHQWLQKLNYPHMPHDSQQPACSASTMPVRPILCVCIQTAMIWYLCDSYCQLAPIKQSILAHSSTSCCKDVYSLRQAGRQTPLTLGAGDCCCCAGDATASGAAAICFFFGTCAPADMHFCTLSCCPSRSVPSHFRASRYTSSCI